MWVLLLGIAETFLCSFLYFTVGIVQCVYQFTSAVITVIFQAIERCRVVSLQSIFRFVLTAPHKIDSLQKTLIRFKEMFLIEATALFVLRKSFHHEAKLRSPHICLRENSVR